MGATPIPYTPTTDSEASEMCPEQPNGCADGAVKESSIAIGAALGGVAVGLLLALVGVVMGWVWSCHKNKYTHSVTQLR